MTDCLKCGCHAGHTFSRLKDQGRQSNRSNCLFDHQLSKISRTYSHVKDGAASIISLKAESSRHSGEAGRGIRYRGNKKRVADMSSQKTGERFNKMQIPFGGKLSNSVIKVYPGM